MPRVWSPRILALLPGAGDNCAIAVKSLRAGTKIELDGGALTLPGPVLEGHRFAAKRIDAGERLLSWGLPFGVALKDIPAGESLCNRATLEELRLHDLGIQLPEEPNFRDLELTAHRLDAASFRPAEPLGRSDERLGFKGYARPGSRGVGTRNHIVVIGTTSRTAAYARLLDQRLATAASGVKNFDGVRAVAHTEGGADGPPNNLDLLLRTLAGFMIHPNTGAALVVDYGGEPVNNSLLERFLRNQGYPLVDLPHHFLSLRGGLADGLAEGERIVRGWLDALAGTARSEQDLRHLKVALQCGGSDAFSGISANPLAGWVAREIIRHGGAANLAETDELIGAEAHVLEKTRDLSTARRFLRTVQRFKDLASRHGLSAEGNPSGGNRLRGLYNISLKSIGAARKRDPEVPLERVIDYAEPMRPSGLHFMDSPGNDLESVAGQVASGANLIFFTTGNGSITNFPFVPTIKIMTTSARYQLLSREMDVNAGAFLDGTPMPELGRRTLDLTIEVASGRLTRGEEAGHYQVSIWRDWRQTDSGGARKVRAAPRPSGRPLRLRGTPTLREPTFTAWVDGSHVATERIDLILPTSLCSGQIARLAAERLSRSADNSGTGVTRCVAPTHTEGCGAAGETADEVYLATFVGCLNHPNVRRALLLEHGCEKMHNARLRKRLGSLGLDLDRFGFASVQLDGGIEKVLRRIEDWFSRPPDPACSRRLEEVGLGRLKLGLFSSGRVSEPEARCLMEVVRNLIGWGATVVVARSATLLDSPLFIQGLADSGPPEPNLGYGQNAPDPGLYIMETHSQHAVESLTGLASSGAHLLLARVADHPLPSHPLVPLLQFADPGSPCAFSGDMDWFPEGPSERWAETLLERVARTASRQYVPKAVQNSFHDFQLARGALGLSM